MNNNKISEHITLTEAIRSDTAVKNGIDNIPDKDSLKRMKLVAEKVFEPLRNYYNCSIYISSFFRCDKLNKIIGGSKSSQHSLGEAIDVDADVLGGVTNYQIFNYIKDNLDFDQLISEFPDEEGEPCWVHFSYKKEGNRNEVWVSENNYSEVFYRLISRK